MGSDTERPSITCPVCGATSHHPKDVELGYCGHCHAFTGNPAMAELLSLLPPTGPSVVTSFAFNAALAPLLAELDIPPILPSGPVPERVREMLFEGDTVSLRHGTTMFYDPNGEPIDLPAAEAFAAIETIRATDAVDINDRFRTEQGEPIHVSTVYLGIDMSSFGPLPLVWETLVFVGDGIPFILSDPWRYATEGAARAGHERIAEAIREAVS